MQVDQTQKWWEEWLSVATSLYPVYVLVGGLLAYFRPSTFTWFVERGPTSYSAALCIIMLAMGFTLRIQDLFDVFLNRPLAVSASIPPLQLRSYLKLAFQLIFQSHMCGSSYSDLDFIKPQPTTFVIDRNVHTVTSSKCLQPVHLLACESLQNTLTENWKDACHMGLWSSAPFGYAGRWANASNPRTLV